MATFSDKRTAETRQPIWLLILYIDQCNNEYGQAPCTASGGQCYYTWTTCEDTANYDQGTRKYCFTNRGAPYISSSTWDSDALPLLKSPIEHVPTEIHQDKFQTERGKINFKLADDDALPFTDPNKSTSATDSGRFWRNWLARIPNYHGRKAELYLGFRGVDVANYELFWAGKIRDINFAKHGITIECVDRLWQLADKKVPANISDNNTVQDSDGISDIDTSVKVADVTEFYDATSDFPQTIKIEDEYILYTGKNPPDAATLPNHLTGLTRGAFGSTAVSHMQYTAIKQAVVYSDDDDTTWLDCTGWTADRIFLDLLCNKAEVDASFMEIAEDQSITCNGAVASGDTSITLNNGDKLPSAGVVKINSELIIYTSLSSNTISSCLRGAYGTTAASHSDGDSVYQTTATYELGLWHQGAEYGILLTEEAEVGELVENLSQCTLCDVYQNEDGKIELKMQAPAVYDTEPTTLTESDIMPGREVDRNEDSRLTQVWCYWGAGENPGESKSDYTGPRAYIGSAEENDVFYGERNQKIVWGKFLKRSNEASWLASHLFGRYSRACTKQEFEVELYHHDLQVGDLVKMQVPEIVEPDGTVKTEIYRIIKKVFKGLNRIRLKMMETGFGGSRYAVISPATITHDYDSATDSEKDRYAWIADAGDKLGSADDDAYVMF